MHNYLRSVGFKCITNYKQLTSLFDQIVRQPDHVEVIRINDETNFAAMSREFAPGMGVALFGILDENNQFHRHFYFPYAESDTVSTSAECFFHEHSEKESYAGSCDDYRINITLIFSVSNFMEMRRLNAQTGVLPASRFVCFSGLSGEGKILLPIQKTEKEREESKLYAKNKSQMMESMKNQDSTTFDLFNQMEIQMYHQLNRQLRTTDLYTLVESYFMPYGVECDQYSLMGTIEKVELLKNSLTGEEIYKLLIDCNDVPFQIVIQKTDLMGVPEVGRRFKGSVWLTGRVQFQET